MQQLSATIVPTLTPPPPGAQLVIFSDQRNYVAEIDSSMMLAAASRYAVRHNVYLVPERFIAANYLCLCMLSPTGEVIGVQRATHLNLGLREHNFFRDDKIQAFDTPFGKIALLVDVDIYMPQVVRAAVMDGATLLLSSQFIQLYDFFEDRIRYGAINAALSNGVQVVAAAGLGGVIVDANGHEIAGFSEDLPVTAQIETIDTPYSSALMHTAQALLRAHKDLIEAPRGEDTSHV
ncbi:nitrilase-related carbon-nitrogen hydrolase [Oscillospiraceae bacterium LTW-04]|nr:carbon-nitrogen hydrolase family protein [Oscillospiraceae bacterium MB24-C1]